MPVLPQWGAQMGLSTWQGGPWEPHPCKAHARLLDTSCSNNWNSGPWQAPQTLVCYLCPSVLFMNCTQVIRSSRSAGCAPWSIPWRGHSLAALGWEFEAGPLHPHLLHGTVSARASHHILCWDNGMFYPIPVRILPWLGHVLSSSVFWAQAELCVQLCPSRGTHSHC